GRALAPLRRRRPPLRRRLGRLEPHPPVELDGAPLWLPPPDPARLLHPGDGGARPHRAPPERRARRAAPPAHRLPRAATPPRHRPPPRRRGDRPALVPRHRR